MTRRDLPRRRPGTYAVVLALVAGLTGCSGSRPPAASTPAASPSPAPAAAPTIDPQLLQPLTALGPCTAEPKALATEPAEGSIFPDDTVLTSQQTDGPLTSIKGYIPMTPV